MAHTNNESKQEAKETDILKESLLLSCSTVGRTTSSCMAERSVQWHEHKLSEQKSELDQKLYKSIIKINSERLEIVDELSKLKKSSSTGALDRLERMKQVGRNAVSKASPKQPPKSAKALTRPPPGMMERRRQSYGDIQGLGTLNGSRKKTLLRHSDTDSNIAITLGGDSSGDESSGDEKRHHVGHGHDGHALHRTISVTSCQFGRDCGSARSELEKFKNATKRYTKELSGKTKGK